MSAAVPIPAEVARTHERVTPYGWKALAGSVIGYSMDGFDLLIVGFMLPVISADLGFTKTQAGSLVSWTLLGAVAGGITFGALSDRFGRIRVLTWTILVFAGFTGLCAIARDYWELVVFRVIAGLGLGGEFGIGMALAAEAWPAEKRARASSYVAIGWQSGVLLAALLTPALLPRIGWRGMFVVGLLPALVAFAVRRTLDEPEIFVQKHAKTTQSSFRLLVKDRTTTNTTVAIGALCSVMNFGYYGIMIWMPTYLSANLGFSLATSAAWTSSIVLGMCLGLSLGGQVADRLGRRPMFLVFNTGALASLYLYSRTTTPGTLLWMGALMGMFVVGSLPGTCALMSEAYPTAARATAQNSLFNIARGVASLAPLAIGALAAKYSFRTALALLSSVYVFAIVITVFFIPELRGKQLD